MAIAPLPEISELERLEGLVLRPALRVVTDPFDLSKFDEDFGADFDELVPAERTIRTGMDVTERRRRRVSARVRRRRMVGGIIGLALVTLLCLPIPALGTVTLSGKPTPGGTADGLADGSAYVVQQGDTLASIAHRINPNGNTAQLANQMAEQVGSRHVVAGERLILP